MEALAGRDQSQTAPQMLTAPGERCIVGGRGGRGVSSRTGRAGTLRLGAAGDGRGAAGSGRSRWRDPSTAAAHSAGRSGGASRPRSLPRTTTPSHRRVLYVGWTFDFIPVVWLLRRVPRSAGHAAPPAAGIHATTPLCAAARVQANRCEPASDHGTRGDGASRRGQPRARAGPDRASRPGGPVALLGDTQADLLGGRFTQPATVSTGTCSASGMS